MLAINSAFAAHAFHSTGATKYHQIPPGTSSPSNCNDAGPGSLRDTISNAASGETIDLTQMACSEITLTSGEIQVTAGHLKLMGPGIGAGSNHHLTIYGGASNGLRNRIFDAGGAFTISGLKLADARYEGLGPASARGGCINAAGDLTIEDSMLVGCEVYAPAGSSGLAFGGAIYAQKDLSVTNSIITSSVAYSPTGAAYGGGISASGFVTVQNSTIAYNQAIAQQAIGGGLAVVGWGDVTVFGSTISGNEADFEGGMRVNTLGATTITNSTLSGNYASLYVGGASFSSGIVTLKNSTVTRNSAYFANFGVGLYSYVDVTTQSSILADNVAVFAGTTLDIVAPTIAGSANLITSASTDVPPNTITACPRLTALWDHGGSTPTHALIAGSPGIDAGSNTIPLDTDQRGELPFKRVFGMSADVGAYEWQGESDDAVFKSAFENQCDRYD
jgi:hypothetical protein